MGNLTFVVAATSYAGQLNLTATASSDSCPDLEVFAQAKRPDNYVGRILAAIFTLGIYMFW